MVDLQEFQVGLNGSQRGLRLRTMQVGRVQRAKRRTVEGKGRIVFLVVLRDGGLEMESSSTLLKRPFI